MNIEDIKTFKELYEEGEKMRKLKDGKENNNETKITESQTQFVLGGVGGLFLFGLLIILVLMSVVVINTGYVGIKHEFGQATTVLPAGIHFVVPFKDNVQLMNTQIIKYEVPSSSASKDLQIVTATITVNYQLDRATLLNTWVNFRGGHESRIIEPLTHETLKSITAQYTASDLITKRELVKNEVTYKLKNSLKEYGLDVIEVSLVNFDFSEEFNKAIEMKMVAEQDKLRMQQDLEKTQIEVLKQVAEAEANAKSITLNADGNAYKKKAEADAEAYYLETTSSAQAEAINHIKQQINGDYLTYWKIENWNGVMPSVMTSSNSNLLLGLDVN